MRTIWGLRFNLHNDAGGLTGKQADAAGEAAADMLLDALVRYVASLQVNSPAFPRHPGGTRAYHYAELTKILGGSNLSMELYERDRQLWFSRYSALSSQKGIGKIDMSAALFSTSRKAKLLWMLAYALPASRTARKFMRLIMWLEPWLTRYPARNGIVCASSRRSS